VLCYVLLNTGYVRVNQFVMQRSRYEYGLVAHALVAAMKLLLREYLVLGKLNYYHYSY
jgi:hypothetical protein